MTSLTLAIRQSCKQVCARGNANNQPTRTVPLLVRATGLALNLMSFVYPDWTYRKLTDFWLSVRKPDAKDWVRRFWNQADSQVEIHLSDKIVPVYVWGQGPLVVCMHGWGGSGTQYREFLPELLSRGYRVALFDAPAHGVNPQKQTNVMEFAQTLLAIEEQLGSIDTVIAHSFGAMASTTAIGHGLNPRRLVLIAPGLCISDIFGIYCDTLSLRSGLRQGFRRYVGEVMNRFSNVDDVWQRFRPEELLASAPSSGLLVFDHQDEEVTVDEFYRVARNWSGVDLVETQGLGHYRILKSKQVVDKVCHWLDDM